MALNKLFPMHRQGNTQSVYSNIPSENNAGAVQRMQPVSNTIFTQNRPANINFTPTNSNTIDLGVQADTPTDEIQLSSNRQYEMPDTDEDYELYENDRRTKKITPDTESEIPSEETNVPVEDKAPASESLQTDENSDGETGILEESYKNLNNVPGVITIQNLKDENGVVSYSMHYNSEDFAYYNMYNTRTGASDEPLVAYNQYVQKISSDSEEEKVEHTPEELVSEKSKDAEIVHNEVKQVVEENAEVETAANNSELHTEENYENASKIETTYNQEIEEGAKVGLAINGNTGNSQ